MQEANGVLTKRKQKTARIREAVVQFSETEEESEVCLTNAEGPPVPIPNTEVKLRSADNTWLATAREDRSTLTHKSAKAGKSRLF